LMCEVYLTSHFFTHNKCRGETEHARIKADINVYLEIGQLKCRDSRPPKKLCGGKSSDKNKIFISRGTR
ncbi:MAG: hypothetical protein Q7R89_00025, partial [bacterium]|nr:hypothetical protein [bacterium]